MVRWTLLVLVLVAALAVPIWLPQASEEAWYFAVSGDSRNYGDVVMPAIAHSVLAHHAEFYWHLGDFRIGSSVDEDMQGPSGGSMPIDQYYEKAWDDFIAHQLDPFGSVPIHLGIGNHELYMRGKTKEDQGRSHADFIAKFSKWLGGSKTAYYHWRFRHVDFISLDNSRDDGFEKEQLAWFQSILSEDKVDEDVHAVAVGMHRALPNSHACAHSMNGDPYADPEDNRKSTASGREAYQDLRSFQSSAHKGVYVFASHSHFYIEDIFNTDYWKKNQKQETPLKGWLIGTAGAKRYSLPEKLPPDTLAITYAYGYLLGTVHSNGEITFEFQQVTKNDVPEEVATRYGKQFVTTCFLANRDTRPQSPPDSCKE